MIEDGKRDADGGGGGRGEVLRGTPPVLGQGQGPASGRRDTPAFRKLFCGYWLVCYLESLLLEAKLVLSFLVWYFLKMHIEEYLRLEPVDF